jgi:microcystin synthetase protein McyJ
MGNARNLVKNIASVARLLMRSDPVDYYQYLGDDLIEGESGGFQDPNKPLWLNLGYWDKARTYPEAASAMAQELGEAAGLVSSDRVLDVGFGFAEQDFYWLDRFKVAHITGLNITPMQVERAKRRVCARKLTDRLDLRLGSATQIPFASGSFSKVTALECAFHFMTRELFFHEAFRVLAPGGRLALADGMPAPGQETPSLLTKLMLRGWATPLENYYDRDVYKQKLEACGFVNVRYRSIALDVFPGTLKYKELRRSGLTLEDAAIPELNAQERADALKKWETMGLTDYLIVSADKPAS